MTRAVSMFIALFFRYKTEYLGRVVYYELLHIKPYKYALKIAKNNIVPQK